MNTATAPQFPSDPHPLRIGSPSLVALFDYIAQDESRRERERILPYDIVDLIRQSRIGALRIPKADGGGSASLRELFSVVIRLGASDANVAHILRNHFSVVERLIRTPLTPQSRQWRDDVVGGALIGLATTELGSSQVGDIAPATTVSPDGDGFRLNGVKYYSTGTLYADYVLVRVATSDKRLATTIVPVKRDGVELIDDWDGSGQRLTGSGTTHFRNVRVEASELIVDEPSVGYGAAYSNTFAQLFLTAINAGIVAATRRDAAALVRRRARNFYYSPSLNPREDPVLQQTVGEISSSAFAAESVVLAAADALDAASQAGDSADTRLAHEAALRAAQAKVIVDELAIRSGSQLFDAGGASATKASDNLDRHWRNARTLSSHNPVTVKAQAIGAFEINATPLPAKGFF
ncbi:acyl-CoA dehydrogenase [Rhodopseudomonas boonkerdii]|uniref:acyl-CoA dehydrogenase family protein n=1 Tax=Rhodopseudomonas boonkerdii TaxID=475937 RepID=UPI001E2D238C|nr:acyl-CoA dehydrogenase family protein [Rhodopseudomonas boonkerdii]UGV28426.1 acyl-CoA dehydrogenase [Rhodopseudomonas boonkerdii]